MQKRKGQRRRKLVVYQYYASIRSLTRICPRQYLKGTEKKYLPGDIVYIVENTSRFREAVVLRSSGGFGLLWLAGGGGTWLRETRLFRTAEDADEYIRRLRKANKEVAGPDDPDRNTGKGADTV